MAFQPQAPLGAPHLGRWAAAALLGLALAAALPRAHAQPADDRRIDRLAAQAQVKGSARVIVGLNLTTQPEGRLGSSRTRLQRESIRAAQRDAIENLLAGTDSRVKAVFATVPHFAAEVDSTALARMRRSRLVKSIEEDVAVPPTLAESTALINATTAWSGGRTGSGWAVAVLDTGVDKNHPFLAGKVVAEACFSSTTSQSRSLCPGGVASSTAPGAGLHCSASISGCNHGTHVAGIVAGTGAADGPHGVARDADVIAIQVFSHFPGQGSVLSYSSDQIRALEHVLALSGSRNIASVNMSLGGGQYGAPCDGSQGAIKAAIDNLRSVGIATVIASGNNGYRNAISGPACVSSAVSVGATCDAGPDGGACGTGVNGVASYSNIAPFVSLLAPGSYISSSVPGTGYAAFNGTSMAAPHVAGAWALLKQAYPDISVADGLELLRGQGLSVDDQRSGGTVDGLVRIDLAGLAGESHALTVAREGTGGGTVSSAPRGISCGSDCREPYAQGTSVTLNPAAATGSVFAGWSGACSGTGVCNVSMTEARDVVARFDAIPYTLTVSKTGAGSGEVLSSVGGIACGASCSTSLGSGTSVTLTAVPATGSRFTGWSGACKGTASTCTVSMTTARTVRAAFAITTHALRVLKAGDGVGTVTSSPSGVNCGSACVVTRPYGTVLTLTATATNGSVFAGWSGACSGTDPCSVSLTEARSVTAQFTRTHHRLSLNKLGGGTGRVSSDPAGLDCGPTCSALMPIGQTVTLTPTPGTGSSFSGWTGACTGTGACTVSMSQARSVSARFVRVP